MNFEGTLIEAAKVGNVSKMLGRSKSEDSVCNSSNTSSPVHGQVRVTYSQNSGQQYHGSTTAGSTVSNSMSSEHASTTNNSLKEHNTSHFFHTTTGKNEYQISEKALYPSQSTFLLHTYKDKTFPALFMHKTNFYYNIFQISLGLTAIAALKKKRKKFSSSKNICPVTESISTTVVANDALSDKVWPCNFQFFISNNWLFQYILFYDLII